MSAAEGPAIEANGSRLDALAEADDLRFMGEALQLAAQAATAGEVPVGAVVVLHGEVVGRGHNAPIGQHDPSAHAEVLALRDAAARLGNYRLGECTLYTTLEPCVMCAGAIQHARIRRLVFGAHDAKAGAAGSVVNLFANPRLNPHTHVDSGVRAEEGARLLSDFFALRRSASRSASHSSPNAWPLREDALRTPPARFADLPDFPWPAHHSCDLPGLDGLRMAYVDEGPRDAPRTWLCLHNHLSWSYAYRHFAAAWLAQGDRVVAPDWVGFGRSDKPKREQWHRPDRHRDILLGLIDSLDLRRIVLVLQDSAVHWAPSLLRAAPHRYLAWAVLQAPGSEVKPGSQPSSHAAAQAPFPDSGHQAAPRAWAKWRTDWEGDQLPTVGAAPDHTDAHHPATPCKPHRYTAPAPMMGPDAGTATLALQMWRDMAALP